MTQAAAVAVRHAGEVKFWKADKGYGFLIIDDQNVNRGDDLFVHVSQTGGRALLPAQRVTFEVSYDVKKGKAQAVNVQTA